MQKVLRALGVLASSSGVSAERQAFMELVPPQNNLMGLSTIDRPCPSSEGVPACFPHNGTQALHMQPA